MREREDMFDINQRRARIEALLAEYERSVADFNAYLEAGHRRRMAERMIDEELA